MVNGLHLYSAFFVTNGHPMHFTILPQNHPFVHGQPCKTPTSFSLAVTVWCLAHGHLDTQLEGAGDWTSNLPVTSQPALPPELLRINDGCFTHRNLRRRYGDVASDLQPLSQVSQQPCEVCWWTQTVAIFVPAFAAMHSEFTLWHEAQICSQQ